jgi:hypothetical protein
MLISKKLATPNRLPANDKMKLAENVHRQSYSPFTLRKLMAFNFLKSSFAWLLLPGEMCRFCREQPGAYIASAKYLVWFHRLHDGDVFFQLLSLLGLDGKPDGQSQAASRTEWT